MCRSYAADDEGIRHYKVPEPILCDAESAVKERVNCLSGSERDVKGRDLERYYSLLHYSRPKFSEAEGCLIMDAMNGSWIDPWIFLHIWISVKDAIDFQALDKKWGVDAEKLLAKLFDLTPAEGMALLDASERFWGRDGVVGDYREALAHAGILEEGPSGSKK